MQVTKLEPTYRYLERIDARVIQRNDDRVVLVVGDEGVGKSTLVLTMARMWQDIRGRSTDADSVLENIVWGGREEFAERLETGDGGDMIAVQDAAHALFSRDVMVGDQKELEKTLMDIRFKNYLIVLGFQDWSDIPSGLVRRRAKSTLYIPRRGIIRGYNRESMDRRYKSGDWPDPDFEDRFPALDGTDLWDAFRSRDEQAKLERLQDTTDPDPVDVRWREQAKIALRSVRPWDPNAGMTYRKASELIDYSPTWVSDRVDDWRKGKLDDLLEQDEQTEYRTAEVSP